MPLNVSLSRENEIKELGSFESVVLSENEMLGGKDGGRLAWHVQHRWHCESGGRSYTEVRVIGPVVVFNADVGESGEKLGPYLDFSLNNGVMYVDRRVFAFFDLQLHDWYMVDIGKHWKRVQLQFVREPE